MSTDITAPAEIALEARQGSPFHSVIQFFEDEAGTQPIDFTGWTFRTQIREGVADSNAPVVADLSSEGSDPNIKFIAEDSSGPDLNGTPDPTNGFLYHYLSSAETSELRTQKAPKARNYPVTLTFYWDTEGTPPGGEPQALAYGTFTVACEVTRGE